MVESEARPIVSIQRMDSDDFRDGSNTLQTEAGEDASPRIYATEEERYEAFLEF